MCANHILLIRMFIQHDSGKSSLYSVDSKPDGQDDNVIDDNVIVVLVSLVYHPFMMITNQIFPNLKPESIIRYDSY